MHMPADAPKIAVIIPCYKTRPYIADVLRAVPDFVDRIIVVDDACPEESWRVAEHAAAADRRITVIRRSENGGVGAAVTDGYKEGLSGECDIFVKIDGDGQMDPADMERIIEPIRSGRADYVKGNRFRDFDALRSMPRMRLFGNSALSFLVKAASGYWNIMDPTNGYTAIHRRALGDLDLSALDRRYFFESDMLIKLYLTGRPVADVPIKARYAGEHSSLRIPLALKEFPYKLFRAFQRRIFLTYFIYDFSMATVYMALGAPLMLFGLVFGGFHWIDSYITNTPKPAGTIMTAALPVILAFQMLLQAIQIDIDRTPKQRD
jgi:glycosyltransferase involved in cell wall biosynthesis